MELHQLHHIMQDGNDTPTYPWSTCAGGTMTETPGFRPMLIPVNTTSETDDDVDPNDFVNGIGFPTDVPEESITRTTPTNPANGANTVHSVPHTENEPVIRRSIPARLTLGSTTFTFQPSPIDHAESHTAMEIPTEATKENIDPNGSRLPLVDLAVQIAPGLVSSYENLDTYTQLRGRTAFTKTESPGSGDSSPMSISRTPSPVPPDQCITINAEISSRSLPISLNLPGLNAHPPEGTWTNSPLI